MSGDVFVDANVLVYSRDASEPEKQTAARSWLAALWQAHAKRLSTQVLNEFYVTVTERLDPGLDQKAAPEDVRSLLVWRPVPLDATVLQGAWTVQDRYRFSFWDALIVAAAQVAACSALLTEDLQDGQDLDGLQVIDPFRRGPETFLA